MATECAGTAGRLVHNWAPKSQRRCCSALRACAKLCFNRVLDQATMPLTCRYSHMGCGATRSFRMGLGWSGVFWAGLDCSSPCWSQANGTADARTLQASLLPSI